MIRLIAVAAPMVGAVAFGAPAVVLRVDARTILHDVAARHRVQFQMPETDAVAMLKGSV